jgi:hypothetical protein
MITTMCTSTTIEAVPWVFLGNQNRGHILGGKREELFVDNRIRRTNIHEIQVQVPVHTKVCTMVIHTCICVSLCVHQYVLSINTWYCTPGKLMRNMKRNFQSKIKCHLRRRSHTPPLVLPTNSTHIRITAPLKQVILCVNHKDLDGIVGTTV